MDHTNTAPVGLPSRRRFVSGPGLMYPESFGMSDLSTVFLAMFFNHGKAAAIRSRRSQARGPVVRVAPR